MNGFGKLISCSALIGVASACNQAPVAEQANEQAIANDVQMSNGSLPDGRGPVAPADPETAVPSSRNTASEAPPKATEMVPRRPDRVPPPKTTRPEPAADPHAGHDMSNMSR